MQSAKRFALAEMSPDNNPFLLTPPRVIKCVTELFGYILDKVYLNNGKDNKVVEYKSTRRGMRYCGQKYVLMIIQRHIILFHIFRAELKQLFCNAK